MGKLGYYEMSAISTVVEGLVKIAKVGQAPPPKETVVGRQAVKKEFHSEETVSGVNLESYLKREPDENDEFVKVVYHDEWVEKVPVPLPPPPPPTPEQLLEMEKRKSFKQRAVVALTAFGIATAGVVSVIAIRSNETNKAYAAKKAFEALRESS